MTSTDPPREKTFFGHPRPLATLFMTEVWERFSFYGMRAILALFLSTAIIDGGLGLSTGTAAAVVGVYNAMVYLAALPGGWLADRVLGPQRAVLVGAVIIMLGHISMAIPGWAGWVYLGLALIVAGTGLLKPNISTMVGHLYDNRDESHRDAGFSIFYMGINLGSLAPFVVGWLGQNVNYHLGFACAAVGMFLGIVQYVAGAKGLRGIGARPTHPLTPRERARAVRAVALGVGGLLLVGVVAGLVGVLTLDAVTVFLTVVAVAVPVGYFCYILLGDHGLTADERSRMKVYLALFAAAAVFWMIFDQAATTLTTFAATSTDLNVFGWAMPSSWTQNINPICIIVFAPLFAALWVRLGDRVSTPLKFAVALALAGLSFVAMAGAASIAATGVKVSVLWLVLVYLTQTFGELCLSPVGLSVTTRLAPAMFGSQMMGVWFLAVSVGDSVGGQVARLSEGGTSPAYFLWSGLFAIAVGGVLLCFVPRLRRVMNEHPGAGLHPEAAADSDGRNPGDPGKLSE
ncbi:oligopeptide:H+ symporter [Actinocorallia sp. A-T 12471]|uniref:peptide MFS transporter n=1 Tax=Actinocorallia sp. A-T 12471 TaxID=3089813 RepID=UPI0029D1EA08|nr:oligopeptide:H+ symporter [Actinocorallia sp. A-T 12471]MDX6740514.1 oligopeptide:H+ symporter [Actinocorallia sp. A-T 12471]